MQHKRILMIAGSGYLSGITAAHFKQRGWHVRMLSRSMPTQGMADEYYVWDGVNSGEWERALKGAEAVINFCGKNINCRHSQRNQQAILSSRILTTQALGLAMSAMTEPPRVWLNASGVDFYRESYDVPQTEAQGLPGEDYISQVCQQWEESQRQWQQAPTRQVALRISMVLGDHPGSALTILRRLTRLRLGGAQGSGRQYISWIHQRDLLQAIEFLIDTDVSGPVNLCAPQPLPNALFMQALRESMQIRLGLPAPVLGICIGTWIVGTASELVLKSRYVIPQKLLQTGFRFEFEECKEAFEN